MTRLKRDLSSFCLCMFSLQSSFDNCLLVFVEFAGNKPPEIYFAPKLEEAAIEGAEKKLYCLGVAK